MKLERLGYVLRLVCHLGGQVEGILMYYWRNAFPWIQ